MKKGFISIYVLMILLALGLTISFIYRENESNYDNTVDFYNRKTAMFEAESLLNIIIEENGEDGENWIYDNKYYDLINNFKTSSEIEISYDPVKNKIEEAQGAKILSVNASYKGTISYATMAYKIDDRGKLKIIYKKVY